MSLYKEALGADLSGAVDTNLTGSVSADLSPATRMWLEDKIKEGQGALKEALTVPVETKAALLGLALGAVISKKDNRLPYIAGGGILGYLGGFTYNKLKSARA